MHEATLHRLTISLVEVVRSQVAVDGSLGQHVVDDDQDRVGDGHGRLRSTTPGCKSSVLRGQVGALGPRCGVCRLDYTGPQPGTALARLAAVTLAGTLVVTRTQAGPGGQVLGIGEAREV